MMDVPFREKLQDALAVVISDEERAGLDILTHGDYHRDEDRFLDVLIGQVLEFASVSGQHSLRVWLGHHCR